MLSLSELFSIAIADLAFNGFIYIIFALPAFLLLWVIGKNFFKARRIQQKQRSNKTQISREILFSISTLLIFCAIDVGLFLAAEHGYTLIYYGDDHQYSSGYFWFSIVIMLLLHDTYFYWAHRLMHHPFLYKYVHKVHHDSIDPSPFAAFSFHPLEALVEAGFYVVFVFVMPVHLAAIIIWQIVQQGLNVIGHMGYEFYPSGFTQHWLFSWKTASTHHNMHHSKFNGNYGLYFSWWDKWCGTEFNDYHKTFEAVHQRVETERNASQEAKSVS